MLVFSLRRIKRLLLTTGGSFLAKVRLNQFKCRIVLPLAQVSRTMSWHQYSTYLTLAINNSPLARIFLKVR